MAYVIGLDAGGSRTRVVLAARDGVVVARYDEPGGGNPARDADAAANVGHALRVTMGLGRVRPEDVDAVVAGLAGLDSADDHGWAIACVRLPELSCPIEAINDAVVAQAGAFAGGPGIVVVAGTGSMITGITESGELITNDHYPHYAGGARHLAFDLVGRLLIGDVGPVDEPFVREVLTYWRAEDLEQLRARVLDLVGVDRRLVARRYGDLAPMITAAADSAPVAGAAVDRLVAATAVGVRLVSGHFRSEIVDVAPAGALARAAAFTDRLRERLRIDTGGRCRVQTPQLDPVCGAALLALRRVGVAVDGGIVAALRQG